MGLPTVFSIVNRWQIVFNMKPRESGYRHRKFADVLDFRALGIGRGGEDGHLAVLLRGNRHENRIAVALPIDLARVEGNGIMVHLFIELFHLMVQA